MGYTENMAKKPKPLPRITLLILILIPSVLLNLFFILNQSRFKSKIGAVRVIGVIDGDTLVLEGKIKVRLRQVDAPELLYCGGEEAKKELETLVTGKFVRLEEQIPDQYGRAMALVYVGNVLINRKMVESGWVRYHYDITKQAEELKAANEKAKVNKLGIYKICQAKENTQNPSCNIKGNIDKANDKKRYYLPDCAQYAFTIVEKDVGEEWFCTEAAARKAGYSKAETCR